MTSHSFRVHKYVGPHAKQNNQDHPAKVLKM